MRYVIILMLLFCSFARTQTNDTVYRDRGGPPTHLVGDSFRASKPAKKSSLRMHHFEYLNCRTYYHYHPMYFPYMESGRIVKVGDGLCHNNFNDAKVEPPTAKPLDAPVKPPVADDEGYKGKNETNEKK